jgi:hypothetical protein
VETKIFYSIIVSAILLAGILVGVGTFPKYQDSSTIDSIDLMVQIIFTVEPVVKVACEGVNPLNYWSDLPNHRAQHTCKYYAHLRPLRPQRP